MVEREISSTYRRKSNPILQRIRSVKESEESLYNKHVPLPKKDSEEFYLRKTKCDGIRNRSWIYSWIHAQSLKVFPTRQLLVQETMLTYCIENNQQCKSGDLILIDAGAEYANYSSDDSYYSQFQENTMTDKSRLQCRFTR
jgi:Xaa-Pro aminopeptidase